MPVLAVGVTIKPVLALLFEVITIETSDGCTFTFLLFFFFIPELFDLTTSDFFLPLKKNKSVQLMR